MSDIREALKNKYSPAELQHLLNVLTENIEKKQAITGNTLLVKKIINSVSHLSAIGIRKTILKGGWSELMDGDEINRQISDITTNPAVVLYTQILITIVLGFTEASVEQEGLKERQ